MNISHHKIYSLSTPAQNEHSPSSFTSESINFKPYSNPMLGQEKKNIQFNSPIPISIMEKSENQGNRQRKIHKKRAGYFQNDENTGNTTPIEENKQIPSEIQEKECIEQQNASIKSISDNSADEISTILDAGTGIKTNCSENLPIQQNFINFTKPKNIGNLESCASPVNARKREFSEISELTKRFFAFDWTNPALKKFKQIPGIIYLRELTKN